MKTAEIQRQLAFDHFQKHYNKRLIGQGLTQHQYCDGPLARYIVIAPSDSLDPTLNRIDFQHVIMKWAKRMEIIILFFWDGQVKGILALNELMAIGAIARDTPNLKRDERELWGYQIPRQWIIKNSSIPVNELVLT